MSGPWENDPIVASPWENDPLVDEKPAAEPKDYRGEGNGRGSRLEAALIGARQGATLGFGDEINAGVRAAGDWLGGESFGEAYDRRLEHERGLLDQTRRENPVSTMAGEVGGAMMLPAGAAARGATMTGQAARGAAAGGLTGAAYGFGEGEGGLENRARSAAVGGGIGAAAGAAAPYVLRGAQRAVDSRNTRNAIDQAAKSAPSADALRSQSQALYGQARARGVEIGAPSFDNLADDVLRAATDLGVDRDVTPKAAAAVRRIVDRRGTDVALGDLETLRKIASNASTSIEPHERKIAGEVVGLIDDYMLNLVDADLTKGTAQGLSSELKQARQLWRQMRNSEKIAQAIEAAKNQASGFENGIRIQFRQIISNPKKRKGFSESEIEAMKQVVRGTPTGNLLRRLSRLSFGVGQQHNVLSGLAGQGLAGTAGYALGGPVGAGIAAVGAPAVGHMAARGAEGITRRGAERVQGLAAAGGLPSLPAPAQLPRLENALARFRTASPALRPD